MKTLQAKIFITADIKLLTGLHIGTSGDFSAIGAVDNIVIRDAVTRLPMIPGSSLKGKMRFLLSRVKFRSENLELKDIKDEDTELKRLFGASAPKIVLSRLQFPDNLMTEASKSFLEKADLDLPYTEIKYENTICRATSEANPRQQERVPAGSSFGFQLIYNVESLDEVEKDFENIATMMELLQDDYLGGHGTRGYGRVKFENIKLEIKTYVENDVDLDQNHLEELIKNRVK